MRTAFYARVSTQRQAQADGVAQQLDRLQGRAQAQGWPVADEDIFRDDGYSGANLKRPGLERLRDRMALRVLDRVLITAPDRLARHYVHQVLLLEEITATGCQVEFLDRPMSQAPHDQLLLQIRGAVAEYERSLIAERMRRGRLRKLQAGLLLPWKAALRLSRRSRAAARSGRGTPGWGRGCRRCHSILLVCQGAMQSVWPRQQAAARSDHASARRVALERNHRAPDPDQSHLHWTDSCRAHSGGVRRGSDGDNAPDATARGLDSGRAGPDGGHARAVRSRAGQAHPEPEVRAVTTRLTPACSAP